MLINELPDDCLLAIFDHISDLEDLLDCLKVCQLIAVRTKKVKYFIDYPGCSADYVCCWGRKLIDLVDVSTLFPNLIIAELTDEYDEDDEPIEELKFEDIVAFVRNHESLKGIITYSTEAVETCCDKLEMLAIECSKPRILRNCSSVKQLRIHGYTLDDFKEDAQYMPNLERLQIILNAPHSYYDVPVLEKLKIVEMEFPFVYDTDICYGFQFIDSCPNLQSAYILLENRRFFVDETIKHICLQDLVIDFGGPSGINWNDLGRLLMKYPNLKHLALRALRGSRNLKDEHIKQLVIMLPNLVIFDVSGFKGVTQKAADDVKDYCKRNGRLTKFYFNGNRHEIESDWPHLSTKHGKISRGFDFMKHCFRKDFDTLPYFLVPIDY